MAGDNARDSAPPGFSAKKSEQPSHSKGRGGIEFSDDKHRSGGGSTSGIGSNSQAAMGIGDGIMHSNMKKGIQDHTPSSSAAKLGGQESSNSPPAPPVEKHMSAVEKAASLLDEVQQEESMGYKAEMQLKEQEAKFDDDIYEDEFEEIDEDLPPEEDQGIDDSGMGIAKMGDSHGITVS